MATPTLAELYMKSLGLKEDGSADDDAELVNPSRSINFLVGKADFCEHNQTWAAKIVLGGGGSPPKISLGGSDFGGGGP